MENWFDYLNTSSFLVSSMSSTLATEKVNIKKFSPIINHKVKHKPEKIPYYRHAPLGHVIIYLIVS